MSFDLGAMIRSAALSGAGYFEGDTARQERERQQRIEDERLERERRQAELAEQEQLIRLSALSKANNAPPPLPEFRVNVDGVSGTFTDEEAARGFRDRNRIPREPQQGSVRVNRGGISREFPDTPEGREAAMRWRDQVEGADEGIGAGGKSQAQRTRADIVRAGLAAAEENRDKPSIRGFDFMGPQAPIRAEPDETTAAMLEMIRAENDIRRELRQQGIADPEVIEAEVRRRLGGG